MIGKAEITEDDINNAFNNQIHQRPRNRKHTNGSVEIWRCKARIIYSIVVRIFEN